MKRIIMLLLLIQPIMCSAQISKVLESALPAVVTVGVKELAEDNFAQGFGFATENVSDVAYKQILDMTGIFGSGSGFVIKRGAKHYVVTNAHVIEQASTSQDAIVVFSIDQTEYKVKVIGGDSFFDIAVLEFVDKPGKEIFSLEFAGAEAKIGESVYAIGNPLGDFPYTVTDGIIAGKNRTLSGLTAKYGYLQSTAPIIWGNSGGPLINSAGKVVGINTRIHIEGREKQDFIFSQFNFALESSIAKKAVEDIISNGKVRRSYLGLIVSQDFKYFENKAPQKLNERPVIFGVVPNSPASLKLQNSIGAEIFEVNGQIVRNVEEALGAFEELQPNSNLTLKIKKDGIFETVTIPSSEMSDNNLVQITSYFFTNFFNAEVKELNGKVALTKKVSTLSSGSTLKGFGTKKGEASKGGTLLGKNSEIIISAAGWGNDMWRVNSLKDLAIAMRLALLNGGFRYGTGANDYYFLSGDKDIQSKTLIY